ncbi:MAG TPA: IS481 family transposase [Solirubrobacterales bacterium]|nr:IS481 family transposase [Solirubrobacterales bacterium]
MATHPKAKLGLAGRQAMVEMIEREGSIRAAARSFSVSPATAKKWWDRHLAGEPLHDRSSRPHRSPRMLAAEEQERICEVRRHTGWGPRLIAGVVHRPHSTVHATLRRHGISRRPRPKREEVRRYEWDCPGELLHMDTKRYSRFSRPGHAATGERSERNRNRGAGYEWAHSIVDDHSRLAHSELHPDERAGTVVGFLERVLGDYRAKGIKVRRLMTDNHFSYTKSAGLRELLRREGIRHITTQHYRPQTNGKVERFQQTMAREWGYGLAYASSEHRARALPHWLAYYNERRPHSGIGDRPPLSRVHDLSGQDS